MTDYIKILSGIGAYMVGIFGSLMIQYIMPPLIAFLSDWPTVEGIMWIGVIIVWSLMMVIVPIGVITWGLTTKGEITPNPFFLIIIAFFWSIFSIFIIYLTQGWITPITQIITYDLLGVLFWIGYISQVLTNTIGIPAYLIIEAKSASQ